MEFKIIKIDGEFAIIEIETGERKVCPLLIFPANVKAGDIICTFVKD